MSQKNRRTNSVLLTGTGLYIALFLAMTALAVTGYRMLLPSAADNPLVPPAESVSGTEPLEIEIAPPELPVEEEEVPTHSVIQFVEPDTDLTAAVPEEPPAESAPTVSPIAPRLIVAPLTGETVAAFNMEQLVYNETLGDWRTHDGIDIAAEAGTHVLAACSGTVLSVADDDLMGTTVVIAHDGGYETTYANLQSVPTVAPEQYVSAGQVIGAVGATSLVESHGESHLHFAVTKDGKAVDPTEFLKS